MIVDANVALKWIVREEHSDVARRLIERGDLSAPDLIAAEIANALWKKWVRNEIASLPQGIGELMSFFDTIEPLGPLLPRAAELAIEINHAAYDCFYLALAEKSGQTLITADLKLLGKVSGTRYETMIEPLDRQVI